jgi:DNA modification methylase
MSEAELTVTIRHGDCREVLRTLPDGSVHCVVTSPPYFGLRDYGVAGQIGLEAGYAEYVDALVAVFREARRVLRDDGTIWLNLGDSYAGGGRGGNPAESKHRKQATNFGSVTGVTKNPWPIPDGLKPKDLIGIPWRVAQALQAPEYLGRIGRERDRVWLSATIDAEGTICGFTHERKDTGKIRRGIHVTVTNSNRAMLDEAYRIWPTSRSDHNAHGVGHFGKLDTFRWIAHDVHEKQQLLAELYPYFVCKQKQALLAWNFLEISKQARGRNKGEEGDENRQKSQWIVHALSRLNHLQSVDLPGWLKEPSSMFGPSWYLRSDVIWSKPNPMPESVTDRPTKAHEYLFLLSKSERYYYDAGAILEPQLTGKTAKYYGTSGAAPWNAASGGHRDKSGSYGDGETRNRRSVWEVATQPFGEAHFATFPPALIEPCILAGCPKGGTVLDPFGGAGTTGLVADRLGRNAILIELNPEYAAMAERRIRSDAGMFADVVPH